MFMEQQGALRYFSLIQIGYTLAIIVPQEQTETKTSCKLCTFFGALTQTLKIQSINPLPTKKEKMKSHYLT